MQNIKMVHSCYPSIRMAWLAVKTFVGNMDVYTIMRDRYGSKHVKTIQNPTDQN